MVQRLTYKLNKFGGLDIIIDGANIGRISPGPHRKVVIKIDDQPIIVARFERGSNRLQQAKSFCKVVLLAMPAEDVVTILHHNKEFTARDLQREIEQGNMPDAVKIARMDREQPEWRHQKHDNGAPVWGKTGMLLNPDGTRSIFDDLVE